MNNNPFEQVISAQQTQEWQDLQNLNNEMWKLRLEKINKDFKEDLNK